MSIILSTWYKPGKVAIDAAWQVRRNGADLRTTLESGLSAAELDPSLVAIGLGGLPNADGEVQLDPHLIDRPGLSPGDFCTKRLS